MPDLNSPNYCEFFIMHLFKNNLYFLFYWYISYFIFQLEKKKNYHIQTECGLIKGMDTIFTIYSCIFLHKFDL